MSNASEHYHALANESAVAREVWRAIQSDALDASTVYPAHSVGGRVWARVALDAAQKAREWDKRVQIWREAAVGLEAHEVQGPDVEMQADAGDSPTGGSP